jgi:DNA helicase-2/ATP-dependent DNA helicase PcrA
VSAVEYQGIVESSTEETEEDERLLIAAQVKDQINTGTAPHEIAVLCRTNALVAAMRDKLISVGLPVAEVESDKKPKDWRLLTLIITQIANPDSWANARLLAREMAVIEGTSSDAAEAEVEHWRKTGVNPESAWSLPAWKIIRQMNASFKRYGVGKIAHDMLAAKIRLYQPETVEELLQAMRESPEAVHKKGISVTTVHAAKGNEFDCVFIPGADLFKSNNMAEERRLFFVAVTRARRWLYVSTAHWRTSILPNKKVITTERQPGVMFHAVETVAEAA